MLRGYWCVVAALVGWLILSAANQPSEHRHSRNGAKQTTVAPQATATPTPTLSASPAPKFTAYPGYNPDPCYHAEEHDTADLCAQWRAAIAAEKAANEANRATSWAIVATFFSFIGVGGLIYTIWQTNGSLAEARRGNRIAMKANARATRQSIASAAETAQALEYAAKSSAAAEKQVGITSENSQRELRAYLDFDEVDYICDNAREECFGVFVRLKNFGRTPAQEIEISRDFRTLGAGYNENVQITANARVDFVAPSDVVTANTHFKVPLEAWDAIKRGDSVVEVYITVTYTDVFSNKHSLSARVEGIKGKAFSTNLDRTD